ncbi:MAG: hypothetical protein M3547_14865 [Acidobacteriota bacterium]|nr:hypothetical protein [Acidobacteriota bacterium]
MLLFAVVVLLLTTLPLKGTARDSHSVQWKRLERAWTAYRATPDARNAAVFYQRLPRIPLPLGSLVPPGLVSKFYLALDWMGPRILAGDRWASRIAFRFSAMADADFSEDLHAILGEMIRLHPMLFLQELQLNRPAVSDLANVVLSLDIDKFADASPERRKAELQARLDALQALDLKDLDLMDLRSECTSLLGEEIVHGFDGE